MSDKSLTEEIITAWTFTQQLKEQDEIDTATSVTMQDQLLEAFTSHVASLAKIAALANPNGYQKAAEAVLPLAVPAPTGGEQDLTYDDFARVLSAGGYENIAAAMRKWLDGKEFDGTSPQERRDIMGKLTAYLARKGGKVASSPPQRQYSGSGGWKR